MDFETEEELAGLCRITMTIEEGDTQATGVIVRGGGSAPVSRGVVLPVSRGVVLEGKHK